MSDGQQNGKIGAALVVGGGIGGMQAALDLAAGGIKVYVLDNKSSIGGVMAQLDKTFPTNDCAMCTQAPRLVEIGRHKDIDIVSLADIESIQGEAGNFTVTINKKPRFVDTDKCTGCGACASNCPTRTIVQIRETTKVKLEDPYAEVEKVVKKHRNRNGPLMPVLQEINAMFNYFPENTLRYVAQEMNYPLAHIYRIATFYSAFSITPRGKYTINVCMGTTCYVRGSERLMDKFSDILEIKPGETTPDMKFTLNSVRCIGCCGLAPAATVGEQVYGKLAPKEIPDIIKKYKGM